MFLFLVFVLVVLVVSTLSSYIGDRLWSFGGALVYSLVECLFLSLLGSFEACLGSSFLSSILTCTALYDFTVFSFIGQFLTCRVQNLFRNCVPVVSTGTWQTSFTFLDNELFCD